MRRLIFLLILLAGCTAPVMTVTAPAAPASPSATAAATVVPTPSPSETSYPILLTVVPRALSSVDVREAVCRAQHTQYQLWPYKLEVRFDDDGYQQCLGGHT